jgi:hypothetical protein
MDHVLEWVETPGADRPGRADQRHERAVAIIDWGHRDRPAITAVTPLDGLIVEQMPYTGV